MSNIFPDVSRWEGKIDFDVMKSKTDYVILKASQGTVMDGKFQEYRSECERVGLAYGVYAFYDDRVGPAHQALYFSAYLLDRPKLPVEIFCDWENTYQGNYKGIKNVVSFMQECERLLKMEMGMYTGYYWFMENTNALLNISQLNYLKNRKLWEASYTDTGTNDGIVFVKVPRPWKKMDIWQYTAQADGHAYGCQSAELDMNERITEAPIPPIPQPQPRFTQRVNFSDGTFQSMKES